MSCGRKARRKTHSLFFNFTDIVETGRLHYFYHSPSSDLPIRDVLGEQGEGRKTEPHLERSAENYCWPCWQSNIVSFLKGNQKYLFLFTKYARKGGKHEGKRYIVGYIRKERCIDRGSFWAVAGETKVYSFDHALALSEVSRARNARHVHRVLTASQTARVLESFKGKPNILAACLKQLSDLKAKAADRKRKCG
jgi:hypothetical protein